MENDVVKWDLLATLHPCLLSVGDSPRVDNYQFPSSGLLAHRGLWLLARRPKSCDEQIYYAPYKYYLCFCLSYLYYCVVVGS
jgi:hypothetical protein